MSEGRKLRIEVLAPAVVKWSADEWKTFNEVSTGDTGKNMHFVELPTENVKKGQSVHFTFFWTQAGHWEGKNYSVKVVAAAVREREPELAGV
jgi:glucoamylase